jgi:hypothetical protein
MVVMKQTLNKFHSFCFRVISNYEYIQSESSIVHSKAILESAHKAGLDLIELQFVGKDFSINMGSKSGV